MFVLLQPWWYTWDGISAVGEWVGGIGAILAVFFAARQVRVAIMQIEENRNLVFKQLEEQRKLAEESRTPKLSIHTATREEYENGRKYRYLLATATNIGNVPVFFNPG